MWLPWSLPRSRHWRQGFSSAGSVAGSRVDAEPRAESGIDADADGTRTVRILGAQLAAREPAIVYAHLGLATAEARAHASLGPAAVERAVLLADGAAAAAAIVAAGWADAVTRRA